MIWPFREPAPPPDFPPIQPVPEEAAPMITAGVNSNGQVCVTFDVNGRAATYRMNGHAARFLVDAVTHAIEALPASTEQSGTDRKDGNGC